MEYGFIGTVLCALSFNWFFALCAGAVFTGFIVCLFISIFKSGYGLKKRSWFFIFLVAFCALLKSRINITGERDFSPILLFSGLCLSVPLFFIRVKTKKQNLHTEQEENAARREFVRFLDEQIKSGAPPQTSDFTENKETSNTFRPEILKAEEQKEQIFEDLDFSHVKNVLQRLSPAMLSYADRRQIHELELALYEAENGGCSGEIKSKINEGLGNLLKIMARHGV